MRSEAHRISLPLAGLLALTFVCCADKNETGPGQDIATGVRSQPGAITDSGKRLSGEFVFQVEEDSYAPKDSREAETRVLTFDAQGNFKVERFVRSTKTEEEGSYLIDDRGELILFFDKVGGALLESARPERYNIISQTDLVVRLEQPPTRVFVLRRR